MKNDYVCGLSFWHPKWLQRFSNTRWFLAIYGLLGTVQGISSTYLVVTIPTLERRFHMPSQTTGIVLSGNEISQIFLSLILSYAGSHRNRPLWIAWGMVLCGLSCLILALPHLIYGLGDESYHLTKEYYEGIGEDWSSFTNSTNFTFANKNGKASLCRLFGGNNEKCNNLVSNLPLVLIFMSQFVLGIGNTLYYSLGQTYLDDNTKKTNTPLLFAYAMAMRMIGPTVGFGLGTFSLSIFIDPSKTPLIKKDDPRWLGAWWLGWIVLGFIMFIFSGLLALFPRQLPKQNQNRIENSMSDTQQSTELFSIPQKLEQVEKTLDAIEAESEKDVIKDFFIALKRIIRNRIVIFNNISGIFYILGASGYMTYLARYMEVQFLKSSRSATSITGPMTMLGMVLGFIVSGWVLSKKRPAVSKVLFWNVIIGCCYVIGQFSYMFFYCGDGNSPMVMKQWANLTNDCNQNCHCDGVRYNPVCHKSSNQLFFSACHAGCKSWNPSNDLYSNCSCAAIDHFKPHTMLSTLQPSSDSTNISANSAGSSTDHSNPFADNLVGGVCSSKSCLFEFYAFSFFTMFMTWLNSTGKIGNILVNYRAVADKDKAFTQGLTLTMLSLFAFIPGPIIFGRVIDNACVVWNYKCGKRGDCQLYDQAAFRYYMSLLALTFTTFGTIFDALVWYYGRNMDLYGEAEDRKNENEQETRRNGDVAVPLIMANNNQTETH